MYLTILMNFLLTLIFALISVAFLTLMERKILSLMQLRLGPNKIGIYGIFQPFSDAIKLFTKESNNPFKANKIMFMMFPSIMIFLSLFLWIVIPFFKSLLNVNLGFLFLVAILGTSVYTTMFMGWSSNSMFSQIGSVRAVAQTISYEVSLTFIILSLFTFNKNFNIYWFLNNQEFMWNMVFIPITGMWMITSLAELNRTPFDLSEAESELVSGFNTEFSGVHFAIIFMAEYMSIVIMSQLTTVMFMGSNYNSILFFLISSLIMFMVIWSRATLPRIRYDKLMQLTWKMFLPTALFILSIFFSILFMTSTMVY